MAIPFPNPFAGPQLSGYGNVSAAAQSTPAANPYANLYQSASAGPTSQSQIVGKVNTNFGQVLSRLTPQQLNNAISMQGGQPTIFDGVNYVPLTKNPDGSLSFNGLYNDGQNFAMSFNPSAGGGYTVGNNQAWRPGRGGGYLGDSIGISNGEGIALAAAAAGGYGLLNGVGAAAPAAADAAAVAAPTAAEWAGATGVSNLAPAAGLGSTAAGAGGASAIGGLASDAAGAGLGAGASSAGGGGGFLSGLGSLFSGGGTAAAGSSLIPGISNGSLLNAGATLLSGLVGSSSAKDAASIQAQSARDATAAQLAMYNQNRNDNLPYLQAGYGALGQLQNGLGLTNGTGIGDLNRSYTGQDMIANDPGYQFRMDQGQKALERSAAARGGLMNGGTLQALNRYGQDYASNEYQNSYNRYTNDQTNRYNRLAAVAGLGQNANQQIGSYSSSTANNVGNNITGAGNALAAGQVGSANAISGAIGSGLNSYYLNNLLQQQASKNNGSMYGGSN